MKDAQEMGFLRSGQPKFGKAPELSVSSTKKKKKKSVHFCNMLPFNKVLLNKLFPLIHMPSSRSAGYVLLCSFYRCEIGA